MSGATTCELRIENFILQVRELRKEYLKKNPCALKVEAFVQRRWGSPYMKTVPCAGPNRWIVKRIGEIGELERRGKIDVLHDMEIVYWWGGLGEKRALGPEKFALITELNTFNKIQRQICAAYDALLNKGDPVQALKELICLKQCGDSFGSKILAMRSPEIAPILDSRVEDCLKEFKIGDKLGVGGVKGKKATEGYERFIRFCKHVADELKEPPPTGCDGSPREKDGRWWLRDVEMAVYQFTFKHGKKGPIERITGAIP